MRIKGVSKPDIPKLVLFLDQSIFRSADQVCAIFRSADQVCAIFRSADKVCAIFRSADKICAIFRSADKVCAIFRSAVAWLYDLALNRSPFFFLLDEPFLDTH